MKYIAIFDIPDDYKIGCATAKVAPKGKDVYYDSDFSTEYAAVYPLSEEGTEAIERFNAAEEVINNLGLNCAFDMPSFWFHGGKDYKVIPTKYHNGYMKALEDVEREIRLRFGFAEKDNVIIPPISWQE